MPSPPAREAAARRQTTTSGATRCEADRTAGWTMRNRPRRTRRRARVGRLLLLGIAASYPLAAGAQVVRFEFAGYSVGESIGAPVGNLEVCLVRTGDLAQRIDAFLSTADGTATGSASVPAGLFDYFSRTDAPVFFFAGVARACQIVSILDDSLEEGDETFRVRITGVTPPGQIGSPSEATVTILDDESVPEGLAVSFLDHGHVWAEDPLIPYDITVTNSGPPVADLVLTEIVPVATVHVAAESTPGWECDPGPDEGSRCRFDVGDLPTGAGRSIAFAVEVVPGTPAGFEILNSLEIRSGGGRAAAAARTPRNISSPVDGQIDCDLVNLTPSILDCRITRATGYDPLCCLSAFLGFPCPDICLVDC